MTASALVFTGASGQSQRPVGKICVSDNIREFASLWPRSDRLGTGHCYAFQCADILEIWSETIGAARQTQMAFVTVLDQNDKPLVLLPLGIERRSNIRILTFLDGGVSDYNAPVVFPAAQDWDARMIQAIWRTLRQLLPRFDIAIFDKMPGRVGDLPNPLILFGRASCVSSGFTLGLTDSWDNFARAHLPRCRDLRRKRRRLSEIGPITFEVAETWEQTEAFLEAMIRQKTRRYLETRGIDEFDRPGYRQFYPEMTHRAGSRGPVHLSALKVNGTIIAVHWGYVVGSRYYYLMPSFEGGDWLRYSPGRLLIEHLLEWSFHRGLKAFDFTVGNDEYKFEYSDETIPLHRLIVPATTIGRGYVNIHAATTRLRKTRTWQRLSPYLRKTRTWQRLRPNLLSE
jgi:CelD/BcsL family acetyltransferase involved in cellulose biosynthesis